MIVAVTLSKPAKDAAAALGAPYRRVKIRAVTAAGADPGYFAEFFTDTQVFHRRMTAAELDDFLAAHAGRTFRACLERTEREEIQILANKKGKVTELRRPLGAPAPGAFPANCANPAESAGAPCANSANPAASAHGITFLNRQKRHILAEGRPVPFLVLLGIMTADGRVVRARHGKFRQINRFLEFLDDILGDVLAQKRAAGDTSPLTIVDFGSGKSYLTFAVQYFLAEIRGIDARIFGLDLKADVVAYCAGVAERLGLANLTFAVGDIADFAGGDESAGGDKSAPDIVVTLHACDTATDYALAYAVQKGARAILSVPCCQHELNAQVSRASVPEGAPLAPILKHGLLKEKFAALATDAVRAELLERHGYKVNVLEFIDDDATPKNVLLRAVRRPAHGERARPGASDGTAGVRADDTGAAERTKTAECGTGNGEMTPHGESSADALLGALGARQTLRELLEGAGV